MIDSLSFFIPETFLILVTQFDSSLGDAWDVDVLIGNTVYEIFQLICYFNIVLVIAIKLYCCKVGKVKCFGLRS